MFDHEIVFRKLRILYKEKPPYVYLFGFPIHKSIELKPLIMKKKVSSKSIKKNPMNILGFYLKPN